VVVFEVEKGVVVEVGLETKFDISSTEDAEETVIVFSFRPLATI
jgi:hypothetical protein